MSNNVQSGGDAKSTGESDPEFGRSMESKAQFADARRQSTDFVGDDDT